MTGPIEPAHDLDAAPFWDGCREGELRIPHCTGCGAWAFPGSVRCGVCQGDLEWETVVPAGVVYSHTRSMQALRPGLVAPYDLVLVDLDGAPGVRLTLRVAGDTEAESPVRVGERVTIEFEHEGTAVPVARRTGSVVDANVDHRTDPGTFTFSFPRPAHRPEDDVVIGGVGRSTVGRKLGRSDLSLTIDAATAAIADAGLTPADIDGVATYPGFGVGPPGYSGPHSDDVARSLGLHLAWHRAGAEGAGQLQPLFDAVLAVSAGLCTNVLVYRTCTESTTADLMRSGAVPPPAMGPAAGFTQWLLPFDAISPAAWLAPYQTRHMHQFGTTRDQVGAIAVTARTNAARHPDAVFTDPITLEDYLGARLISEPLGLLDCDVPVDGSVAVVVSRADRAGDLRTGATVRIEAIGAGTGFAPSWHQWPDLTTMASHGAAASMWARTSLTPADVHVAELYDGFAFLALFWLEAMGFCGHGDGGAFVEGGGRIALDGELPLNTHGGQLSGGRLHGWGFLEEAIHQVRGSAGDRQVPGAEVAAISTGGGPIAGCALLTQAT